MLAREIEKIHTELKDVLDKKLPIKLSFVLSRNLEKIESVTRDIDTNRSKLIEKYAERDEDGKIIEFENNGVRIGDVDKFSEELSSILDADISIEFDKVKEEDIEKCEQDGYDVPSVREIKAMQIMVDTGSEEE